VYSEEKKTFFALLLEKLTNLNENLRQ